MIQRPQTLLFFGAAIIALIAAFAPIATYSSKIDSEIDPKITISATNMDFTVDKPEGMSDKEFEEGLVEANKELDEELSKRSVSIIFSIGFIGMILLAGLLFFCGVKYKNRKLQMRLGTLLTVMAVLVTLGLYFVAKFAVEILVRMEILPTGADSANIEMVYNYGFFIYPLIAILTLVGVLLVRKDDNLIKSVDRIR